MRRFWISLAFLLIIGCQSPPLQSANQKGEVTKQSKKQALQRYIITAGISQYEWDGGFTDNETFPAHFVHPCRPRAYVGAYRSYTSEKNLHCRVRVHISFHKEDPRCLKHWLFHDLYTYFIKCERGTDYWIKLEKIDGNLVLRLGPGTKQDYLRVAWISSDHLLVLIRLDLKTKGDRISPKDPIVLAYLKKYPSVVTEQQFRLENNRENYIKRKVQRCLEYAKQWGLPLERQMWLEFERRFQLPENYFWDVYLTLRCYTMYAAGRPLEWYKRPCTVKDIERWWKKHKDLPLQEWYDRGIDRVIKRLNEATLDVFFVRRREIEMHTHFILPPLDLHESETPEGMKEYKENWNKWWKYCRGKTQLERYRYTTDLILSYLDETKIKDEKALSEKERQYYRRLLNSLVTYDNPFRKLVGEAKTIKGAIKAVKKWWKKNKKTYDPYTKSRYTHLPVLYWE